jgi:hypothetical protein
MIQWLIDQASPGLDKSQINSHQESNKFPPWLNDSLSKSLINSHPRSTLNWIGEMKKNLSPTPIKLYILLGRWRQNHPR